MIFSSTRSFVSSIPGSFHLDIMELDANTDTNGLSLSPFLQTGTLHPNALQPVYSIHSSSLNTPFSPTPLAPLAPFCTTPSLSTPPLSSSFFWDVQFNEPSDELYSELFNKLFDMPSLNASTHEESSCNNTSSQYGFSQHVSSQNASSRDAVSLNKYATSLNILYVLFPNTPYSPSPVLRTRHLATCRTRHLATCRT